MDLFERCLSTFLTSQFLNVLIRDRFEAVTGELTFELFNPADVRRVLAGREQFLRPLSRRPRLHQGGIRILAIRQTLLLAAIATGKAPETRFVWIDPQLKPSNIRELVELPARLCLPACEVSAAFSKNHAKRIRCQQTDESMPAICRHFRCVGMSGDV